MLEEIPKNRRFGYVRVSSKSQEFNSSIDLQKQQLIQNQIPPENIRIEVGSAANEIKNRPIFQKLIQKLQENDLLMGSTRKTKRTVKNRTCFFNNKLFFLALNLLNNC